MEVREKIATEPGRVTEEYGEERMGAFGWNIFG
jgi:hypothetical protein